MIVNSGLEVSSRGSEICAQVHPDVALNSLLSVSLHPLANSFCPDLSLSLCHLPSPMAGCVRTDPCPKEAVEHSYMVAFLSFSGQNGGSIANLTPAVTSLYLGYRKPV